MSGPEPAATYTGDPSNRPIDLVRVLVGDTNVTDMLLFDSEVQWCIDEQGEGLPGAVRACELIVAKFSRDVDYGAGKTRESASKTSEQYRALAQDLKNRLALGAVPWVGGLSESEAETDVADTDLRQPQFYRDQFANPQAPQDPGGRGSYEDDWRR